MAGSKFKIIKDGKEMSGNMQIPEEDISKLFIVVTGTPEDRAVSIPGGKTWTLNLSDMEPFDATMQCPFGQTEN